MQAYDGLPTSAMRAAATGRARRMLPLLLTLASSLALAAGLGALATSLPQHSAAADAAASIGFVAVVALVTAGVGHWFDVRSGQRLPLVEDDGGPARAGRG